MNPPRARTTPAPANHAHNHDEYQDDSSLVGNLSEDYSPPVQKPHSLLQSCANFNSNYSASYNSNYRVDSNNNNNNSTLNKDDMLLRSNRLIEPNTNNDKILCKKQQFAQQSGANYNSNNNNNGNNSNSSNNNQHRSDKSSTQVAVLEPTVEEVPANSAEPAAIGDKNRKSAAGKRVIQNRSQKFSANDDAALQRNIREEKPIGRAKWDKVAEKYNKSQTIKRTGKQLQKHFTDSVRRAKEKQSGSTARPPGAQAWLELHDELEQHYAMQTLGNDAQNNTNYQNQNQNNQGKRGVQNPTTASTSLHQYNVHQQIAAPQITNNFSIYSPSYYSQGALGPLSTDEIAVSVSRHTNKRVNAGAQISGGNAHNASTLLSASHKKARLDEVLVQMLTTENDRSERELKDREIDEELKRAQIYYQQKHLVIQHAEFDLRQQEIQSNEKWRQREFEIRQQEFEAETKLRQEELKLRQEDMKLRQEELLLIREQHRMLTSLLLDQKAISNSAAAELK
jgi:hypothetical protein